MKVAVIGTGRMGKPLGKRWALAGHEVMYGSRTPDKAVTLAGDVGYGAQGGSYADAAAFADVILLSVPYRFAQETISAMGDISGKIVIECTNDLDIADTFDNSSGERIAEWLHGARVVKAFNTIFDPVLSSDKTNDLGAVFMTGDDDAAKAIVSNLVRDAGFDPIDAGGTADSHYLDSLVRFLIHISRKRGGDRSINYRLGKVF